MSKPKLECPAELVPLLGRKHDHQIAHLAGVSKPIARRWRIDAGKQPPRGPIDTSSRGEMLTVRATVRALDALPGKGWADLARRIGVSRQAVQDARTRGLTRETLAEWSARARAALPIPSAALPWSPPEVARMGLGVEPDDVIAAREGVSMALVADWRRKAGLPSPTRGAPKMSPADTLAALEAERVRLGCATFTELAAKFGVVPSAISKWRAGGVSPATLRRYVVRAESAAPNLGREDS